MELIIIRNYSNFVCVSICLISSVLSQTSNILLIEYPNKLNFYDQFEQKIETPTFASLTPFKVLKRNTFLSDELTPCISVEFQEKHYFILKDGNKKLINFKNAGLIQLINSAKIHNLVYQIKKTSDYYLNIYLSNKTGKLAAGSYESVIDLNRFNLIKYASHKYVWVRKSALSREGKNETPSTESTVNLSEIISYFEHTNKLYKKFGLYFLESEAVPFWNIEQKKNEITCLLKASDTSFSKELLKEMYRYLNESNVKKITKDTINLMLVIK